MKEQDLKDLGFSKVENEFDDLKSYYYILKIGYWWPVELHTECKDELNNNDWFVELSETCVRVSDKDKLSELITVLKNNVLDKQF